MIHFIPAWYQGSSWSENESVWYVRRNRTEFDDTVKQIQLFHRNGSIPCQITLLSHAPNLRHFLHRQSIYHAPFWSCFDAIQEIRTTRARVFSFHDLRWPEDVEFIYSAFAVVAFRKKERYAELQFGEDGNLIRVELYQGNQICRKNVYDDRGFLSVSTVYTDGKPEYSDYLTENGVRKLRVFQADGRVEINPDCRGYYLRYRDREVSGTFRELHYPGIASVIREVFAAYLALTDSEDIFCAALDDAHAGLIEDCLKRRKLILSVFEERCRFRDPQQLCRLVRHADYIVTDSEENTRLLLKSGLAVPGRIRDITPYDSRLNQGMSEQVPPPNILLPVDGLDDAAYRELLPFLAAYLQEDPAAVVHLFTRRAEYDRKARLLNLTMNLLRENGYPEDWAAEELESTRENELEEKNVPIRFQVDQCVDELSVSRCLRGQRVIADMRAGTDLYLFISAISMGIPLVAFSGSRYIQYGKNGLILEQYEQLPEALRFYLSGLREWNRVKVHSYELSKRFTADTLMDTWKGVIETVESDSSSVYSV